MGSIVSVEKIAAKKIGCTVEEWREKRSAGLLWCYECKSWLKAELFTIDNSRGSGKKAICKPCNSLRSIRCRYKLTREELANLQISECSICERSGQKMEVDHDHDTGKVRALLCSRCNGALGQFCDDIELLKKAINYLKKYGRK